MKFFYSILICGVLIQSASCQNTANTQAQTATQQNVINQKISVDEYEKKLAATPDAQLIDVRTPDEFGGGHLNNATNIDFRSGDFMAKMSKLDKNKPLFLYCLSGGRSTAAAEQLAKVGFKEIYNMDGGYNRWHNENKPCTTDGEPPKPVGISMAQLQKVMDTNEYCLVDYNAKWCEPCRRLFPILTDVGEKKKNKLLLIAIDIDKNRDLAKEKKVNNIPYLELYKRGKLVWSHEGFIEEDELLKHLNF